MGGTRQVLKWVLKDPNVLPGKVAPSWAPEENDVVEFCYHLDSYACSHAAVPGERASPPGEARCLFCDGFEEDGEDVARMFFGDPWDRDTETGVGVVLLRRGSFRVVGTFYEPPQTCRYCNRRLRYNLVFFCPDCIRKLGEDLERAHR